MKNLPVALLSVSIGAVGGYFAHDWLHGERGDAATARDELIGGQVVACTLSPEQIEHLSARIAPAVVDRLGNSCGAAPDPDNTKVVSKQAAAFAEATRIMDEMIGNHAVTAQGRNRVHELLRDSGQADRIFEVDGRIAAAINRGEITAADAGLGPPPQ